jgi:hypothetical protein
LSRIDYIKEKFNLPVQEAVADRGYGSGRIISELYARGIQPLIPLFRDLSGSAMPDGFQFIPDKNIILCPNGEELKHHTKKDQYKRLRYHVRSKVCLTCDHRKNCGARILNTKSKPRFVQRSDYQGVYELTAKQMNTSFFKQALSERFYKIEGLFSEAKRVHKLSRAQFRGRKNMQIQTLFTATVQNIKRMVTALAPKRTLYSSFSNLWLLIRPSVPYKESDPFKEPEFKSKVEAKIAISNYLGYPLAQLNSTQMEYINNLLSESLNKQIILRKVQDYFTLKIKETKGMIA